MAGVPPLAGFMGKAMLLQSVVQTPWGAWVLAVVLASSLLVMVALARTGSVLFWSPAPAMRLAARAAPPDAVPPAGAHRNALLVVAAAVVACSVAAGPLARYAAATSAQLFERNAYLRAVLDAATAPAAIDVRREMREREAHGP